MNTRLQKRPVTSGLILKHICINSETQLVKKLEALKNMDYIRINKRISIFFHCNWRNISQCFLFCHLCLRSKSITTAKRNLTYIYYTWCVCICKYTDELDELSQQAMWSACNSQSILRHNGIFNVQNTLQWFQGLQFHLYIRLALKRRNFHSILVEIIQMRPFRPGRQHRKGDIWKHKEDEEVSPIEF